MDKNEPERNPVPVGEYESVKASNSNTIKYEKGIQEIPAHHLITLADFYHVTVDYLLGRKG